VRCFLWFFLGFPLLAAPPPSLLQILGDELERNFSILKQKADPAPYYLSYEVTETETEGVSASSGTLNGLNHGHRRQLDITLRVGSPKLDNYHLIDGQRAAFTSGMLIALDNVPDAIRRPVWLETDRVYRAAARRLIEIKSDAKVKVAAEDQSNDFSVEEPSIKEALPPALKPPDEDWRNRVRAWSGEFQKYPGVLSSSVVLSVERETKYMVSTEGTRLAQGRTFARVGISAHGRASDGLDLAAFESFEGTELGRLPKPDVVEAAVKRVAGDVTDLLRAPAVEPFIGPAILSGRAAGVFFHEIFGHRIEGHRQRDEGEGQTFTKSIGTPVLPQFLSVLFDPTRKSIGTVDLNGSYAYDDEGVKARPLTLVEDGVLKTFLMSRTPVAGFEHSNGHGRRQPGREVVSRQSNLFVESKKQVSDAQLRAMLVEEIKRQDKPYGLFFRDVTGGYTTTQRRGLQAFTVVPLIVYKVYPDGRPDELVRGVDIVGTPLASFAKILATSNSPEVFNGYCGAESGSVPVSAVSPAILVSEIEVQKKSHSQERPPFLSRPSSTGGSE
jgi:TldD protein